jgi:hypothetical protein
VREGEGRKKFIEGDDGETRGWRRVRIRGRGEGRVKCYRRELYEGRLGREERTIHYEMNDK